MENRMKAIIWSKENCSFCVQAKNLLNMKGIEFEERKLGEGYTREQLLEAVPGASTIPQIFINGEYVGGFKELKEKFLKVA